MKADRKAKAWLAELRAMQPAPGTTFIIHGPNTLFSKDELVAGCEELSRGRDCPVVLATLEWVAPGDIIEVRPDDEYCQCWTRTTH